jgi:hypothetical protein
MVHLQNKVRILHSLFVGAGHVEIEAEIVEAPRPTCAPRVAADANDHKRLPAPPSTDKLR